ncbi:MAG: hypothetical protein CM1200mP17_02020 [Woeseia sp.]|nr:MAG: hypothetical protein CM1200mP17_02020 [Woeseia sp.]
MGNSDEVKEDFIEALKDGAVRFFPYSTMDAGKEVLMNSLIIMNRFNRKVLESCEYPTDGVVVEITHIF